MVQDQDRCERVESESETIKNRSRDRDANQSCITSLV